MIIRQSNHLKLDHKIVPANLHKRNDETLI